MKLSEKEAYYAMFKFLEIYYFETKSDDVGSLLGSMSFLADGDTVDSAMWVQWLESIEKMRKSDDEDFQMKLFNE